MHICTAGLWQRYFLGLFRGEKKPAVPKKPPMEHKIAGVMTPYTPAQMLERTAAYEVRKATWEKTMQVGSN
jgi:hypothetical protein